jgi:hypothetical protein
MLELRLNFRLQLEKNSSEEMQKRASALADALFGFSATNDVCGPS